jgi:hypothetical protein
VTFAVPVRGAAASAVPAPPNDDYANALRLSDGTSWLTPDMRAASLESGEVIACDPHGRRIDRSAWYSLDIREPGTLQVLMGGREGSVTTAVYGPFSRVPASVGAVGRPRYCVYGTGLHKALTETVRPGRYLFQLTTDSSGDVAPTDLIRHWWMPMSPDAPVIHRVVAGDTLWAIARDAGVPLRAIVDANPGIASPRLIHPGEQIAVPACATPAVTPTGWWTGDRTATDKAGDLRARLVGDATYGRGMVDGDFRLDGAGDYVSVRDDPTLDVADGDLTVSLWVLFDSTAGEQILAEKWVQHFADMSLGWTLTKLATNEIGFYSVRGGTKTLPLELVPGAWYHVAARIAGDRITVYVNGVPSPTVTTDESQAGRMSNTSSLKFGHRGNPQDTTGSEDNSEFFLHGAIDEVQLWVGAALSDQDILDIARAGAAGTCRSARADAG